MTTCPEILLAGHKGAEAQELCARFWQQYQLYNPAHEVFSRKSSEERRFTVPVLFHGDKGRGLLKTPVFIFSFESAFGLSKKLLAQTNRKGERNRAEHGGKLGWSCGARDNEQVYPDPLFDDSSCPKRRRVREEIFHNGQGHVFLTRFLGTCIPNKVSKEYPGLVKVYLNEVCSDFTCMFEGMQCGKERWSAALLGIKGDFEFHFEVGSFNRSYANIGTKTMRPFCPECNAGKDGVLPFDFSNDPAWARTLYVDAPWDEVPPLSRIPYSSMINPASLYKRDCFHILKFGFLKDFTAGLVMWLAKLTYWDVPNESREVNARLSRAYSWFKLYCMAEKKTTTLRKFTKGTFHCEKSRQFPEIGGKGSDSVVLLQFLEWFLKLSLRAPKEEGHRQLLMAMLETSQGALAFVGVLHSHGLFLTRSCASFLLKSGRRLLKGYGYLAKRSLQENRRLFKLRPKVHFFAHVLYDLQQQLGTGHQTVFNSPAAYNNEANEDFIGRVARISRRVSARTTTRSTIGRYKVAAKLLLKRAGF